MPFLPIRNSGSSSSGSPVSSCSATGADVAEHVRGDVAERIVADQAGDQGHAGQVRAVDRDARDLGPVEILAHRERHERAARVHLGDHFLDALLGQGDQTGQRLERGVQIGGLLAHHQNAIGRAVAGERHAIAVEDAPAIGRHQAVIDPVLVGEQRVLVGVDRLQVVEPPGERAEQGQLAAAEQQRPARERCASAPSHGAWLSRGMWWCTRASSRLTIG